MSNPETWADLVQFIQEFPDTDHWTKWRSAVSPMIDEAILRGYHQLFRAGSSMHHLIFSTLDHHGLRLEPRVTIRVTEELEIGIYYSTGNIHFDSAIESVVVSQGDAFPIFTRYLRHLWEETVPEPIPEELRQK